MLSSNRVVRGAQVSAIDPESELTVSEVGRSITAGSFATLSEPGYNIVLGSLSARALWRGCRRSDRNDPAATYAYPVGQFPAAQVVHGQRYLRNRGAARWQPGVYTLASGQKLLGLGTAVQGVRLRTADLLQAPAVARSLQQSLPGGYSVEDWG